MCTNAIDILAMTETWLESHHPSATLSVPGFTLFRNDRVGRGGGTALYVRSGLRPRFAQEHTIQSTGDKQYEQLAVKVDLKGKQQLIFCCYSPPKASIKDSLVQLEETFLAAAQQRKPATLLGDFNINLLRQDSNMIAFCDLMEAHGYNQLISDATRITANSCSLLALAITPLESHFAGSFHTGLSDHCIIFCVLNVHRPFTAQTTERRRNFANFSDSAFCDDLRTTDWSRLATNIVHEDANAAANSLTDILNEVLERHAPMKSV